MAFWAEAAEAQEGEGARRKARTRPLRIRFDEVHGLPPLERVPAVCLAAREQIVCNK